MPRRRFSRTSAEDHSGPLRVRTLEPLSPPRLTLRVAAALRGKPGGVVTGPDRDVRL